MFNKRIVAILALAAAIIGAAAFSQSVLASRPEKVTVCHAAGRADNPTWVELEVPPNEGGFPQGHFTEGGSQEAGHERDYLGACVVEPTATPLPSTPTPTDVPPTPTVTPTDVPFCELYPDDPECQEPTEEPTPTEEPSCEELQNCQTEEPTPPPPADTPEPELPKAGFVSQGEIMNGEPWQLTVPGNVWAGHNQTDWPAGQWWLLWEGKEFLFNGQWYATVEYIIADPTEVELIGRAIDFDLMLITCRGYDPETNAWAERLVIFADLSD